MSNTESDPVANHLAERIGILSKEKRELLQRQLASRRPVGYDLVATALRECGVTHIYGVAGRPTENILPACDRQQIRPIGVYHHTSAVCMATAHNYQAGNLVAAALVSAGPATTNAMTGLLVARDNGWPVIVLGGRRTSFQKFDVLPMVRHITKHAIDVPSAGSINECVRQAYEIAMSDRPGPVYLDLHEDVLTARADAEPVCAAPPAVGVRRPLASDDQIESIATALLSAERPALMLGKGVRWTDPQTPDRLVELIETLNMPFITSPMGRGFIPEDHPLCFNLARGALQSQADVVVILGARLNWVFRHGAELSHDARVIHVDVHEHDEDAAIETTRVHGDAGNLVERLLDRIGPRCGRDRSEWLESLRAVSDKTERWLDQQINGDEQRPMSPYRMMKEVRDALSRDSICITEGNVSMMSAQPVIAGFTPASRMDAGTSACMGVGIPFAIGAKLARPDRPVVAVTGDYGFSLSAMEMEVCVRHLIRITFEHCAFRHGGMERDRRFG